jgi:murein DD-endopeptidase MepM/ murein hydrolase activator NlpD
MSSSTTTVVLALLVLVWLYQLGAQPAPVAVVEAAPAPPVAIQQPVVAPIGAKSVVTEAMVISADFYATGSPAWAGQGGMHYGVDYAAPHGSPVFMPFDCAYEMTGFYGDAGRFGQYLICDMAGYEYYSGHLEDVQPFAPGQVIGAGSHIGYTNELAHSHIQLRDPSGALVDFAAYYAGR